MVFRFPASRLSPRPDRALGRRTDHPESLPPSAEEGQRGHIEIASAGRKSERQCGPAGSSPPCTDCPASCWGQPFEQGGVQGTRPRWRARNRGRRAGPTDSRKGSYFEGRVNGGRVEGGLFPGRKALLLHGLGVSSPRGQLPCDRDGVRWRCVGTGVGGSASRQDDRSESVRLAFLESRNLGATLTCSVAGGLRLGGIVRVVRGQAVAGVAMEQPRRERSGIRQPVPRSTGDRRGRQSDKC